MTSRIWNGATANWYNAADWIVSTGTASVPLPGDTLTIAAGTVEMFGTEARQDGTYDAETVLLGAASASLASTLLLSNAITGAFFDVASGPGAGYATISVAGTVAVQGSIEASAPGGTLTIAAAQPGAKLVLLNGGTLTVTGGDTLHLLGAVEAETPAYVDATSAVVNDGTYALNNSNITFASGASLTGTGTFEPGWSSSVTFLDNVVSSAQTIDFNGPDARLRVADPAHFSGVIMNFASGDIIDLTELTVAGASYDAAHHLIVVYQNTVPVETFTVAGTITGALTTIPDGDGGSYIEFAGQPARMAYEVDEGDVAMRANVVRATMTTASGAPIDGTGVRIGILSDSFDADGNADSEAASGYLPANPNGTSAVRVLKEGPSDGIDEGRAMAELIHQVAPGAQIDFYTASNGQTDFAAGVAALAADGCTIIVDDWSFFGEPFYQVSGPVDTAIARAVASGVNYFTAAGNDGAAWFESAWTPMTTTLAGVTGQVSAMRFDNATPYQTITLLGGVTTELTLQWDAAFPTTANVADSLAAVLYDMSGNVVGRSTQLQTASGLAEPAIQITAAPAGSGETNYQLAIYRIAGSPTVGQFKYILFGAGAGSTPGGYVDDPAAETGSGTVAGHALVAGVNTVGAVQWPNSAGFGNGTVATESFSSVGPGTLLFDASGNRLASPVSDGRVTLLAPDGENVAVPAFDQSFFGTSAAAPNAAAVAALMLQANPALTTARLTADLIASASPAASVSAADQGAGLIRADLAVQAARSQAGSPQTACFASGTRLLTPDGARRIDDLQPGDPVATASGRVRPVRWVGRRTVDCCRHPDPGAVTPVRIQAEAFAPRVPSRDLLLSPDHAVAHGGVLIPVRHLINGATVRAEAVERVTYLHVELDAHDLVLAEGLACESYLDTGNRSAFEGGGPALMLHPDFARRAWTAGACAPHCAHGPALHAARAALLARAVALGHPRTSNPLLRVLAGPLVLHPSTRGQAHVFDIPEGVGAVRIRSRSHVPAESEPDSDDPRRLGVQVVGITLDGAPVEARDHRRGAGWHAPEPHGQWTNGDATLVVGHARRLEVCLGGEPRYWLADAPPRLNRAGA